MNKKVVIGSRESKLAVLQSQMVKDYIVCRHPQMDVEILTMKTTGDKILVLFGSFFFRTFVLVLFQMFNPFFVPKTSSVQVFLNFSNVP